MIVVVGRGRVGTALQRALAQAGVETTLAAARSLPETLAADAYLLCVRDPFLAKVAREVLARHRGPAPVLLHTAGGVPSQILRDAGAAQAGLLHPLLAFADAGDEQLAGALFVTEGDARPVALAGELVARLGGVALPLQAAQLPTYHAAAVLASNHVLGLVAVAHALLRGLGVADGVASTGLGRLLGSVAGNLVARGLPDALTGPIARGDVAAVQAHLAVLPAEARRLYAATARPLLELARAQGAAAPDALAAIDERLELYAPADLD